MLKEIKDATQEELTQELNRKAVEFYGYIEKINEETRFKTFGTSMFAISDEEETRFTGGGSVLGSSAKIAALMLSSEDLKDVLTAAFKIDAITPQKEEDDE